MRAIHEGIAQVLGSCHHKLKTILHDGLGYDSLLTGAGGFSSRNKSGVSGMESKYLRNLLWKFVRIRFETDVHRRLYVLILFLFLFLFLFLICQRIQERLW